MSERNRILGGTDYRTGVVRFDADGNRIEDAVVRDNRDWAVFVRNGSSDNRVRNLTLATATVSFEATDVALRSGSQPPDSFPERRTASLWWT